MHATCCACRVHRMCGVPATDSASAIQLAEVWHPLMLSPQDVVTGMLPDGHDKARWLMQRKRYQAALAVAESDPSVPPAFRQQVRP